MKYQHLLTPSEHKSWLEIQTSIGNNELQIDRALDDLKRILSKLNAADTTYFENVTGIDIKTVLSATHISDKKILIMLLIKRFIHNNNLLIMAEFLNVDPNGNQLEIKIFLILINKYFSENYLPNDLYVWCMYRTMGTPATWLKIEGEISTNEIIDKVDINIRSLCIRFSRILKQTHRLRFSNQYDDVKVYIFGKSSKSDVPKTENHNKEIQRIVYAILIIDISSKRIGFLGTSKRSPIVAHQWIRQKVFPDQSIVARKDIEEDEKEIFKKLVFIPEDITDLSISSLQVKKTKLPLAPSIKLEETEGRSVDEALTQLKPYFDSLRLSDIQMIWYKYKNKKFKLITYGKDWELSYVSIVSQRKTRVYEGEILTLLENLLGFNIKEARLITRKMEESDILEKFIKDKSIIVDPPIPEYIEEFMISLINRKLLHKPKKHIKRKCLNIECNTHSWTSWKCPTCGNDMIVIGQSMSIDLNEGDILKSVSNIMDSSDSNISFNLKRMTRQKRNKNLIEATHEKSNVTTDIIFILKKEDIAYLRIISREGRGTVVILHPHFIKREEELKRLGAEIIHAKDLSLELHNKLCGKDTNLTELIMNALNERQKGDLTKIYADLKSSQNRISKKGLGYDEVIYEDDIKNIFQGLVPNVKKLGTDHKGRKVPDGYCSFKKREVKKRCLFGWDAKFSIVQNYRLNKNDFKKQVQYLKWLNEDKIAKKAGKLKIYAIISNFNSIRGFKTVLRNLHKSNERPVGCKIILINDELLSLMASWILKNHIIMQEAGDLVASKFFEWLASKDRSKYGKWHYVDKSDWISLERAFSNV